NERSPRRLVLVGTRFLSQLNVGNVLSNPDVLAFRLHEIAEQFPDICIGRALQRGRIELARLRLDLLGLPANLLDAERPHHPDRVMTNQTGNVMPTDKRNMIAELALEEIDQLTPVLVLFVSKLAEDLGGRRILSRKPRGIIGIDSAVLFLERDREGEN